MIAGVGIDIVEYERIDRIHERYQERFAKRILDEAEMQDYMNTASPVRLLAKRFAAKEAASKALGTGFRNGITLSMICIRHDENGKPLLELKAKAAERADLMGVVNQWVSISDEDHHSVAMVIFETSG